MSPLERLDPESRRTMFEFVVCSPQSGGMCAEYVDQYAQFRGTEREGWLQLMAWLVLAREACGEIGAGRA